MPRADHRRRSKARKSFVTGPPSPVFLRWVRRILFAGWAAVVARYAPDLMRRFNEIRAIDTPGFDRSGALRELAGDAIAILVTLPGLVVALLGFGIFLSRGNPTTGGRFFETLPTTAEPTAKKRRRRKVDDEQR